MTQAQRFWQKARKLVLLMVRKFGGAGIFVAVGRVAFLIFVVVVSRVSGSSDFGLFIVALIGAQIGGIVCTVGTGPNAQIVVSDAIARNRPAISFGFVCFALGVTTGTSVLAAALLGFISLGFRSFGWIESGKDVLLPLAMLLVPMSLSSLREFVARAFGSTHLAFAPRDIYWTALLSLLLFIVPSSALHLTVIAPIALLGIETLAWLSLWRKYLRPIYHCRRNLRSYYRRWTQQSSWMLMNFVVGFSFERVDTFAVSAFTSLSTAGVYAAASRVAPVVSLCQRFIVPVVLPSIASALGRNDLATARSEVRHGLLMSLVMALPAFLALEFLAGPIMSMFGSDFTPYGNLLRILALAHFCLALNGPLNAALMGGAPPHVYARIGWIALIATCLMLVPLTIFLKAEGAAIAVVAGIGFLVSLVFIEVNRRFELFTATVRGPIDSIFHDKIDKR